MVVNLITKFNLESSVTNMESLTTFRHLALLNLIETAAYILNRVLIRKIIYKTPYEILRGRKPSIEYFKVIRFKCIISQSLENSTSKDSISYNGIFLGYSQTSKAYIVLNKETLKIEESLNVTFDESLPKSRTSPLVDDDVIEEHVVQNHDRTQNSNSDLEEILPRVENIKEIQDHPIDQVIRELVERTLRSRAQDRSNFFAFV
ncbi:retrovirus-related pol polyprotein from transposon TNT 1-94 [Tanacetum coccineum]